MNLSVKQYLKEISKEDQTLYFLLTRIYLSADITLITNFYKYFNNQFILFLKLILFDDNFILKLNLEKINKIFKFLTAIKDYQDNYLADFKDSILWNHLAYNIPLGNNKYSDINLLTYKLHYQNTSWLYKLNISPHEFDKKLITSLIIRTKQLKESKQIDDKNKDKVLNKIKSDDYDNDFNVFLATHNGHSPIVFNTLICDNDFLEICSNHLSKINLNEIVINNIIDILKVSIAFKTLDYQIDSDFVYHYKQIKKEKLKTFDYQKAKALINLFLKQKKTKELKRKKSFR